MNFKDVKKYLNDNKIIFDLYLAPSKNYQIFLADFKDPNLWKKRALPFRFHDNWEINIYWVPVVKENMEFFKTNTDYRKQAKSEFKKEMTKFKSFGYDIDKIKELYKKILWDEIFNILFNNK